MPRGDKSSYSDKQRRQAEHIEESYEKHGTSKKEAERRAWATVNKETGGAAKKSASRTKRASAKKAAGRKSTAKKSTKTSRSRG